MYEPGLSDEELEQLIKQLPPHELVTLRWHLIRRSKQIPPDPLPYIWFLLGGRGSGKTLTGANHVYEIAKSLKLPPGKPVRVGLISETFTDVRITMIEGETGLRSIIPRDLELTWNRSMGEYKIAIPGPVYREIHFFSYSSERPELLRGPQHHIVWLDEPAKLKDADEEPTKESTTWSNMMMGLRLGDTPHCVITGTPVPNKLVKYIVDHPRSVTHVMSSLDNEENLPEGLLETIRALPKTSRIYRQEVLAEILLDNPDSIISQEDIDTYRADAPTDEELHLVLGYDPSMTANTESDEAGIVLGGFTPAIKEPHIGPDGKVEMRVVKPIHAYVLEDHSGHLDPATQIKTVTDLIIKRSISELILEQNQGAGFVLNNLKTTLQNHPDVKEFHERQLKKKATKAGTVARWRFTLVYRDKSTHTFIVHAIHAKINKVLRADSVAIRYQTGQVHHPKAQEKALPICDIPTCKASIEDQMVLWDETKKDSPDRMDAAVYMLLHIFGVEHALSNRKPATVASGINVPDLPGYDPRTKPEEVLEPVKVGKKASAYNIDIGGSSDRSNGMGIAGIRRLPGYPSHRN